MHTRFLISSILIVVVSAIVAQAALAGGAPKNQWPFTRPVGDRTTQSATRLQPAPADVRGEAKNELPFTRLVVQAPNDTSDVVSRYLGSHSISATGEAKNELPFTRPATPTPNDQSDVVSRYLGAHGMQYRVQAEAKNEPPFNRPV